MQLTSLESSKEALGLFSFIFSGEYTPGDMHKHTNNKTLSTHVEELINDSDVNVLETVYKINTELTVTPLHPKALEFDEVVMGKLALMLGLKFSAATAEASAAMDYTLGELYSLSHVHQK